PEQAAARLQPPDHWPADFLCAVLLLWGEGPSRAVGGPDAAKASWTQLAATAEAGARQITVADATGWEVGDRIAIASADFEMDQAEEAVITAISARTLTLDRPLAWTHFGEIQTYSNGERAWDLDSRAEVALLSRNVTIRGDGDSPENGIGGHIMAMAGAEMRLSGVELVHMGQAGALGRYPVHWHMLGDAVGQFIEDASIHHSFNRAVTIHGTGGVRVSDTVAYDVIGHAYFLEDGLETGNLFERNLGFVTRAADPDAATTPTDASHVSTFWITNPSNDFIGNRAAGSDHGGFWFALPERVLGLSAHTSDGIDMSPAHMPLGLFYQNTGHSNAFANLAFDGQADPVTGRFVETEYRPDEVPKIRDFTSYKSGDRAIWIRATAMDLHNVKSADNARATFFSYNQTMYDSLIVGRSANIGTPETPSEIAAGRSLPDPFNGRYFRGHSIYDGPSGLVRVHFAGFQDADAAFQTNGAAQKSPAHFVTGITFDDVTEAGRVDFSPTPWVEYLWSSGLRDLDGSLTGIAGATVLPILATSSGGESRFNVADGLRRDDWGAWIDPDTAYGLLRADTDLSPGQADQVLWQRSDGETIRSAGSFSTYHQTNIALDTDLTYRLQYHALPGQLTLSLRFAGAGESAIIEIPSLPTEIGVLGAAWATSRSELEAAETTTVWRDGQSLWVKLVAETDEVDPRFVPNSRLPEATARRHTAGIFVDMGGARAPVIADFATPPPAALDPHRAHLEMAASGQSIGWQVLDNGDAMSGHADFSVPIDRSDWTGYGHLRVEGTANGSAVEVLLEDASEGLVALGRLGAGTTALDLSNLPTTAKDEVDRVIFRTAEPVAGEPAEIALFAVTLDAADLITVPVVIGAPARAGETFGIVSDAIKGPQKADGPLTVVAVGEAHGGRVATGLPGQADHVFFTPDPGWLGPASFRVSLSDGAGRTAETTVHLDVVT
ncbi:MAG: Ig-like domain-containing protein, partial [Paracoccaceae bacterium]